MKTFARVHGGSLLLGLLALLALAACGGGGGSSSVEPTSNLSSSNLVLSGTAAQGAAIASANVSVKCATGTGSASTRADGGFDVTVSGGALPCVLRVTTASGMDLHSVATGTGSSAQANISPLTELALASALGSAPSTLWDSFEPSRVSSEAIAAGVSVVQAIVASTGYATDMGNPFTALIVPGDDNNPADEALDRLNTALGSQTLEEFRARVINGSPNHTSTTAIAQTSLPPELQLAPKAAHCASLASGRYRVLGALGANRPFWDKATLDATTLILRQEFPEKPGTEPEISQLTAVTGKNCEFTGDVGNSTFVVGAAGVILNRYVENGISHMALMFPEQSYTLADLEGEWLLMETETGAALSGHRGGVTLTANGTLTAGMYCENFGSACDTDDDATLAQVRLNARADGGFDLVDSGPPQNARLFGFRAGNGQLHLIGVASDGGWMFLTRKRVLSLPVVGAVSQGWSLDMSGPAQAAGSLSDYRNTVTSTNPSATPPTYTRDNVFNFTTMATVPETIQRNWPADGFQRRMPATGVTSSDGTTRNVKEWIAMPLVGTGLNPRWLPGDSSFSMSLGKP
jgi:hypothetical protein